jgi:hypothetical protein
MQSGGILRLRDQIVGGLRLHSVRSLVADELPASITENAQFQAAGLALKERVTLGQHLAWRVRELFQLRLRFGETRQPCFDLYVPVYCSPPPSPPADRGATFVRVDTS